MSNRKGKYKFKKLPPGIYSVVQVVPDGWVQVTPASPSDRLVLLGSERKAWLDFGNISTGLLATSMARPLGFPAPRAPRDSSVPAFGSRIRPEIADHVLASEEELLYDFPLQ